MSESQKPLQILDIFNTQNFITNKDYVTYKAQGIVTVPNGLKFGDGSYLNGDLYSVNGTLVLDLGTDGTDATFNGDINGDLYGDIYQVNNEGTTKILDSVAGTFTGDVTGNVTGDLTGDIYNLSNQQVFDAGDGTVSNPATFLTAVNFNNAANFTGTMLINSTLNLTNDPSDMACDFISDTDTGIRYNSANSFNLVAGNNNIFSVSQNQTTTNGTMKIVETGGTYGSASDGSLELYHATGQSSSIIFQGNGNDYGFIRYIDDWKSVSDLNSYSDLLLGPDRVGWGAEKSTLFIGTQNNATQGGDDSIVIRPSASLILDTGSSSNEVSTNAGNIYMKPNGGSVVIGQPDIEGVSETERVTYQGVPLTVVALDSHTDTESDIFEVLKLERKLNDIGNSGDPNNDGGGYIGMHINDYNTTTELARIAWRCTDTGNTERSGKIEFYTTNTGGQPAKRMTIDHNGNVGIGTETPTSALDVVGAMKATTIDVLTNLSAQSIDASLRVTTDNVQLSNVTASAGITNLLQQFDLNFDADDFSRGTFNHSFAPAGGAGPVICNFISISNARNNGFYRVRFSVAANVTQMQFNKPSTGFLFNTTHGNQVNVTAGQTVIIDFHYVN